MKKILATAAVLAFAGSAYAGSFVINAAVDFGGVAGGIGAPITYDGTPNLVPGGFGTPAGIWNGNNAQTGVAIASPSFDSVASVAFAPGTPGWGGGQFSGSYFNNAATPINSGAASFEAGDFQAIILAHFDAGVSNINFDIARVTVNSIDQIFNGLDSLSADGFSITVQPNPGGGSTMYLINGLIPTPGAAGLLGLAGLAAVRRRR
jgi:hypothetical protein